MHDTVWWPISVHFIFIEFKNLDERPLQWNKPFLNVLNFSIAYLFPPSQQSSSICQSSSNRIFSCSFIRVGINVRTNEEGGRQSGSQRKLFSFKVCRTFSLVSSLANDTTLTQQSTMKNTHKKNTFLTKPIVFYI